MVAQKQTLLSALPADNPLSAAAQIQSQATLDKQVGGHLAVSGSSDNTPVLPHLR